MVQQENGRSLCYAQWLTGRTNPVLQVTLALYASRSPEFQRGCCLPHAYVSSTLLLFFTLELRWSALLATGQGI